MIGLVKSVGKEYAETGITVNALAPAVVRTAMVDALAPEVVKYMTDKIPMKRSVWSRNPLPTLVHTCISILSHACRCCTLEEVASITKFIVSPEASFNTGFTFDITGGRAVY